MDVRLDTDGASYVQRLYEIESIFFNPEADAYACAAPPGNITGGALAIGVYRTPEPQIMEDQVVKESLRVCDSILTLQIDDPDNGTGSWVFDPNQYISQVEVATDEFEVSIDAGVKSAYTVLGESPYQAVYQSQANATGCIGYDTIDLYFYEEPAQAVARDTFLYLISSLQLMADPPTAGWGEWELTKGSADLENDTVHNTLATGLGWGENNFTWTVKNGEAEGECSTSWDISIVRRHEVNRYQGFSPNGDMRNEYFIMQGLPYSDDFTFTVFNSLGSLVRTVTKQDAENMEVDESLIENGLREDEMVVWDGRATNGNFVPSGTYYYVITFFMYQRDPETGAITNNNPEDYEFPGYVVVVRE
jgi:hypothetical protein